MENVCSILSPSKKCMEGRDLFLEDLVPLMEVREDIGEARLNPKKDEMDALIAKLPALAKPIQEKYGKHAVRCSEKGDEKSCGYEMACALFQSYASPLDAPGKMGFYKHELTLARSYMGRLVSEAESAYTHEVQFDSGATISAVSVEWLKKNSQPVPPFYGEEMAFAPLEGVSIDIDYEMDYHPQAAIVSKKLSELEGYKHDDIIMIGLEVLMTRPYYVNQDELTITFTNDVSDVVDDGGWHRAHLNVSPMGIGTYSLSTKVYLDGRPVTMTFDTGADNVFLWEQCREAFLEDMKADSQDTISTADGDREVSMVHGVPFSLGGVGKDISIMLLKREGEFDKKPTEDTVCGVLGTSFLRYFNYAVDPTTNSIYLKPRDPVPDYSYRKLLIFSYEREDGGMRIKGFTPGSPFKAAGLKKNDLILKIGGKDIGEVGFMAIEQMYLTQKKIPVVFKRNGKVKKVVVKPPQG